MLPGVAASHSQKRRSDITVTVAAVYDRRQCRRFRIVGGHRPPLQLNSLSWRWRLPVRARSGAAHEHFSAIKVFHKDADAFTLSTLGLICEDLDLGSDR